MSFEKRLRTLKNNGVYDKLEEKKERVVGEADGEEG